MEMDCASDDYNLLTDFIESQLEFGADYYIKRSEFQKLMIDFLIEYHESTTKAKYLVESFKTRAERTYGVKNSRLPVSKNNLERMNVFVGVRKKGSNDTI